MQSKKFSEKVLLVSSVLGSTLLCGGFFKGVALGLDYAAIENVNLEIVSTEVTTANTAVTQTFTSTFTTTSTVMTSTATTIPTTAPTGEIILDSYIKSENDPVEPISTYREIQVDEVIEPEVVETTTFSGVTEDEYRLLVLTVYHEAGNQSLDGKKNVASLVMNRVNLEAFPNSVYSVLTQPGQFPIDFSSVGTPNSECYTAVDYVLTYGSTLPIDVKYFHDTSCTNSWALSRQVYCQVGDLVFTY